jgi:hypothetical protein
MTKRTRVGYAPVVVRDRRLEIPSGVIRGTATPGAHLEAEPLIEAGASDVVVGGHDPDREGHFIQHPLHQSRADAAARLEGPEVGELGGPIRIDPPEHHADRLLVVLGDGAVASQHVDQLTRRAWMTGPVPGADALLEPRTVLPLDVRTQVHTSVSHGHAKLRG